jgi:hypothetical protein
VPSEPLFIEDKLTLVRFLWVAPRGGYNAELPRLMETYASVTISLEKLRDKLQRLYNAESKYPR